MTSLSHDLRIVAQPALLKGVITVTKTHIRTESVLIRAGHHVTLPLVLNMYVNKMVESLEW